MIRILCADISCADEQMYRSLYERASEERRKRADRYLRYEGKLRCVTADALLRTALGTDTFQIQKNEFGKPYIKDRDDFYYNLSHSGNYVVLAFGNREVGIDIQKHEENTNIQAVAQSCFTRDEREYVGESTERFYEIWTGKESYLKYVGKGLRGGACSVSVRERRSEILFLPHLPREGYSMSLCAAQTDYTLELLNMEQL